jgi:four helix bundle protein
MALVAHDVALEVVAGLKPLIDQIARQDRALGEQIRCSASSVVLNLAEGAYSQGRIETSRFHTAAGSAGETRSALRLAEAWGYIRPEQRQPVDRLLDRTLALLWGLTHRRNRPAGKMRPVG